MKKIFKSRVFAFVLGALLFGSIGVVSAYTILANDIGYTPSNTTWEVDNVKDAIDDLYTKANNQKVATQVATLTTQGATYTMQNDGYIIGSIVGEGQGAYAVIFFSETEIAISENGSSVRQVSLFAPKDTVISTRSSYGTYNLTVYEWK